MFSDLTWKNNFAPGNGRGGGVVGTPLPPYVYIYVYVYIYIHTYIDRYIASCFIKM